MGITTESREKYHPQIDRSGNFIGGERDYRGRLEIIESVVDFSGKRVLDLGCSGGFFSFSIARKAKLVTAVDADSHMIKRNQQTAKELGCQNIDFICERISPDFLKNLPKYDVVLFLSVFHHMLVQSPTYDWTDATDSSEAWGTLNAIKDISDILVFEMGEQDEGFRWCTELGRAVQQPLREWVPERIFGPSYSSVRTLAGAASCRWPFKQMPQLRALAVGTPIGRKLTRLMAADRRDFRQIFVGQK